MAGGITSLYPISLSGDVYPFSMKRYFIGRQVRLGYYIVSGTTSLYLDGMHSMHTEQGPTAVLIFKDTLYLISLV